MASSSIGSGCFRLLAAVSCMFIMVVGQVPTFTKCPAVVRKTIVDFDPMLPAGPVQVTWTEPRANSAITKTQQIPISYTHTPGSEFPLGHTEVVYTATDYSNNAQKDCSIDVYVAVQPHNNHTFTESVTPTGFVVAWPELEDESISEYYILTYQGKRDIKERITLTASQQKKYTYTKTEVVDLLPGELYTVEVATEVDEIVISTTEQWTRPLPPINLASVITSPSSVELSWTAPSSGHVEQYRVIVSAWDQVYVTNTTDRITVGNLRPDLSYTARVNAVVGSGDKRFESSVSVTSFQVPLNESQLIAYNYTDSTIEVTWLASSATGNDNEPYMLFISTDDDDEEEEEEQPEEGSMIIFDSSPAITATFRGLKPNTEYRIRLISNLGLSLSTSQKTRPKRVGNFRPTEVLENSITLEWDPPTEDDIDDYSYEVHISPSPGETSDATVKSVTRKVFSSLKNGTEYFFRIVSFYEGMESVPQTLMVTAGVTKAVVSPLNIEALVVGVVLGLFVIVLAIVLFIICRKYRTIKGSSGGTRSITRAAGRENIAMDQREDHRRHESNRVQDNEEDMYEDPDMHQHGQANKPSAPEYQNTVIGPLPKPRKSFNKLLRFHKR